MSKRLNALTALLLSGALALTTAMIVGGVCHLRHRASCLEPNPQNTPIPEASDDDFPVVDWDYWTHVNPDVIGWVTVPGTSLDYPIVQAHEDNPQFYLTHDVYGSWNFAGCPYLDAGCKEEGLLESRNAVIFGHNLGFGDDSMFATFASYTDEAFAKAHAVVYLQTPSKKTTLSVMASDCVAGWDSTKRTHFANERDFEAWYEDRYNASIVKVIDQAPDRIATFVTCSYNRWSNERTLVYCSSSDSGPSVNSPTLTPNAEAMRQSSE